MPRKVECEHPVVAGEIVDDRIEVSPAAGPPVDEDNRRPVTVHAECDAGIRDVDEFHGKARYRRMRAIPGTLRLP